METETNRQGGELTSWKAIADYLGINVRTAQRWETERGLPIHRLGGDRGRVIASRPELDQWKAASYTSAKWWKNLRFLYFYSVSVTLLALAAIAITLSSVVRDLNKSGPYSFFWRDLDLVITDDRARELWRHRFSRYSAVDGLRLGSCARTREI